MKYIQYIFKKTKSFQKLPIFSQQNKTVVLSLLISFIFVDSLFIRATSDLVLFGVFFFYLVLIKKFQLPSKLTFLLCLSYLIVLGINFALTQGSGVAEKLSVWFFLFMLIGIWQRLKE